MHAIRYAIATLPPIEVLAIGFAFGGCIGVLAGFLRALNVYRKAIQCEGRANG